MDSNVRFRIAIVDDEPSMRRALGRLLSLSGFFGDTYSSGEEFLRSLATHRPDCVILDLYLPDLTGFEVQARMAEAGHDIPVITITGHDSPAARQRALAGGAKAYLVKPVSEEVLLAAVQRSIDPGPSVPPSRVGSPPSGGAVDGTR